MYIARIYEKIVGDRNIYTTKRIPVPRPEFFVLYNGVSPHPDKEVLRLSDAFEETGSIGKAIIYCREHDILKEFLEKNATEVMNMLMVEWNMDDALAVRYEEGQEKRVGKRRPKICCGKVFPMSRLRSCAIWTLRESGSCLLVSSHKVNLRE